MVACDRVRIAGFAAGPGSAHLPISVAGPGSSVRQRARQNPFLVFGVELIGVDWRSKTLYPLPRDTLHLNDIENGRRRSPRRR